MRDKKTYDIQYARDNITRKYVQYNSRNPEDVKMLSWCSERPEGYNAYIKRLIREDMAKMGDKPV